MPDPCAQAGRVFLEQPDDDRLRDAQQVGVVRVQALGRGPGQGGEDSADGAPSSVPQEAVQQAAHRHQFEAAHVEGDDADERRGLGLLLQHEHAHVVQPQFGGEHRAGRPAAGDDHVEVGFGRAVGRRLRGVLP